MSAIYLDHAAATPPMPAVITTMTDTMTHFFGNASSIHQTGRQAQQQLTQARQTLAHSIQVQPDEIILTSGGTESDNLALIGVAFAHRDQGKHLITSAVEHPAVLQTMAYLETQGFEVTYLPVTEQGTVTVDAMQQALREDTILVSIMAVNNETGIRMPLAAIGRLLQNHPAVFHSDAVQAYGLEELHPKTLGIDLLSVSAHKISGPKGIGFLYCRKGVKIAPLIHGGRQENQLRAGTENVPAALGFATAAKQLTTAQRQQLLSAYQEFEDVICTALTQANIPFSMNGAGGDRSPHILNLRFPGVASDILLLRLDLQQVAVSTGSACSAGVVQASHVLAAMYGAEHPAATESLRISFGRTTTLAEITAFAEILVQTVLALQKMKN